MKTKKLRVLILEDSKDDFLILMRELNKGEFKIEYALVENAVDFENALQKEWDVIIADYSLPAYSGFDALKLCNKKGIVTSFIVVSGIIGEDIAVDMMRLGARDYIMKNSMARLLPAIRRELEFTKIKKEQIKANNALKVSEHHYHSIFDHANEGLIMISLDGKLIEVNQAFAQMHGYTVDELKSKEFGYLDFFKENTAIHYEDIIRRANQGEVVRFEAEHCHKNGSVFPLSVTLSKISVAEDLYLAFHQDISERKKAERDTKKRMEDLEWFNNITIGRELKMIELKEEINKLLNEMGKESKYGV
jgi:PAS domain S-box-containing protein